MSIDYDRLRELADKASPGPWRADEHDYMDGQTVYNANGVPLAFYLSENNAELVALAPDMARELIRLHDGVEQAAGDLGANADYAPNVPAQTAYLEAEQRLTGLLNGDTE